MRLVATTVMQEIACWRGAASPNTRMTMPV